MKKIKSILSIVLLYSSLGIAADDFVGSIPSSREDNSHLPYHEIGYFNFYCGSNSGDYEINTIINKPSIDTGVFSVGINDLNFHGTSITNVCVFTTVDTEGRESRYSTEVSLTKDVSIPKKPILTISF